MRHGSGEVSPAHLAGKVGIIDFWATWCEPCKKSFPFYEKLRKQHAGRVEVIAVSIDEEPSGIAAFVAETGASFPVGWDEGQTVAHAYEPPAMPTSYVLDRAGIVRVVQDGYRQGDDQVIAEHVERLLQSN